MKRKYQKSKVKQERAMNILFLFTLTAIALFFLLLAMQHRFTLDYWDEAGAQAFCGEYRLEEIERLRNTIYRFYLHNGDIIDVPSEYIDNMSIKYLRDINENYPLEFKYTTIKHPISNTHSAISIVSLSKEQVLLDEALMKSVFQRGTGTYFTLGFSMLCVCLLWGAALLSTKKQLPHKNK